MSDPRAELPPIPWTETQAQLVKMLDRIKARRIYLSHYPEQEADARKFAFKLRRHGFDVIVAADARPHKHGIVDKADEEIVSQAIGSCDVTVVFVENLK